MKAIDLREEVKCYILNEIRSSLMRLGINAPLSLVVSKDYRGNNYLTIESAKFQTMPVMFKEVMITGTINADDESKEDGILVNVSLDYRFKHFNGGNNGAELGRIVFFVEKELPKVMTEERCRMYIQKVQGIEI